MNPKTGEIYQAEEVRPGDIALAAEEAEYLRRLRKVERMAALEARRASAEPTKFHYSHKRHHR
jgi:hypothetical protein